MSSDSVYYAERAIEERRLAMASADLNARRVHLELAAKYALLAGPRPTLVPDAPAQAKDRTG